MRLLGAAGLGSPTRIHAAQVALGRLSTPIHADPEHSAVVGSRVWLPGRRRPRDPHNARRAAACALNAATALRSHPPHERTGPMETIEDGGPAVNRAPLRTPPATQPRPRSTPVRPAGIRSPRGPPTPSLPP